MLEQNLNELNIFALRDFARRTGVSSPTSKKKEQLIKEIVEIVSGAKEPSFSKSKQGRPPKVFGYDFSNVFNNKLSVGNGFGNSSKVLNQEITSSNEDVVTVAGWLEVVNDNAALLWVEKNFKNEIYFVPSELLRNVQIKMGDRAVAEIGLEEGSKIVKKVFSINDCPITQISENQKDYLSFEHCAPTRKIEFETEEYSRLNLMFGENVYVYGNNNNDNSKKIIDMLNSSKVQNKIYINVSVAEKNKIFLKSLKYTENFVSNITDNIDVSKKIVFLAIERAKRILETQEDALVVVDDLNSIRGIDECLAKSLVSLTKETGKGSITLLSVMPDYGFSQIEKLADVRLCVTDSRIEKNKKLKII